MIADLHSDLLLDLAHHRVVGERDVFRRRHLGALTEAGVRVQVLAIWTPTMLLPEGGLRHAMRLIDAARREEDESEGALRLVASATELDEALDAGAIAGILGIEGAEPLGREPELVATFARLGVRVLGPTWNRSTPFADGVLEDAGAGFTRLGHRLLDEMAAAGVAIDLSHLAPRASAEAVERFPGAIFASHSNAAAIHPSVRNISDELIRGIGGRGGVVGLNFIPAFAGSLDVARALARHATHIATIAGSGVAACGADFMEPIAGDHPEPRTLEMPADPLRDAVEPPRETAYAELAAALGEQAGAVLWENAIAFLRRALAA